MSTCFVALGDSFTAGTGVAEEMRWADRLARTLRAGGDDLVYRNLAADGATSADVLGQVQLALQLEPDLVTVVCGANDVLRSVRPDLDGFDSRFAQILDGLRDVVPGALLVTATVPESWRFLDLRPRTRERVSAGLCAVNCTIRSTARARGIPYLEVTDHPGLEDPGNFSADGLHPSALGHARVAHAFAQLLREQAQSALAGGGER